MEPLRSEILLPARPPAQASVRDIPVPRLCAAARGAWGFEARPAVLGCVDHPASISGLLRWAFSACHLLHCSVKARTRVDIDDGTGEGGFELDMSMKHDGMSGDVGGKGMGSQKALEEIRTERNKGKHSSSSVRLTDSSMPGVVVGSEVS